MIYCRQCGTQLNDNSTFCTSCGAPVQQPPYTQAAYNPAPAYAPQAYTRPATQHTVLNSYLGIILLSVAFMTFLFTGVGTNSHFLDLMNISNFMNTFAFMLPLALAAALTTRARGADLSAGSVMLLSQMIIAKTIESSGSWVVGLLIALLACAVIGTVNGFLSVYLKLPALAVTGVMFFVVYGITRLITVMPILVSDFTLAAFSRGSVGMLIFSLLILAAAFMLNMLTSLKTPMFGREKKKEISHFLVYIVGSVLAAFSGLLLLSRLQMAIPYVGYDYVIFTLFVSGCIASSRLLDNPYAPIPVALAAALTWCIKNNVLLLLAVDMYTQLIISILLTAIFGALAIINWTASRKELLKASVPH